MLQHLLRTNCGSAWPAPDLVRDAHVRYQDVDLTGLGECGGDTVDVGDVEAESLIDVEVGRHF